MPQKHTGKALAAIVLASMLSACSSGGGRPKPAELPTVAPRLQADQVWKQSVGSTSSPVALQFAAGRVAVAAQGQVLVLQSADGAEVSRAAVGATIQAGTGFDGHMVAVVTDRNELVAVVGPQVVWRQRLPSAVYTPPLVAGQRVFVLSADRTVQAFDGNTGIRLWLQSRTGEPLVLRHPGVLLAVGDTLVAGLGGRLVGFNPSTGAVRWDVAVATPRGGNDIERLVDLVGPAYRVDQTVCVRAFQAAVGCVDAQRGTLIWRQNSDGQVGLSGDGERVFGTDSAGRVQAWKLASGEPLWSQDVFQFRQLGAPLWLGRSVVVSDAQGWLHLLSREDGSLMARLGTDGSTLTGPPLLAGDTLIAQTRSGQVMAWRPR